MRSTRSSNASPSDLPYAPDSDAATRCLGRDGAERPPTIVTTPLGGRSTRFRRILGVRFFIGDVHEAITAMKRGGLLVVPAAPALKNLPTDAEYRESLLQSDVAITDSSLMVLIWNRMQHDSIRRLSGLEYFKELIKEPELSGPGGAFWIMANEVSLKKNRGWLLRQNIPVSDDDVYIAPFYGPRISDQALLQAIKRHRPKHIIVTIGGGNQERLGLYLKRNLDYVPSIHCIGAAIAFLSGDQVHIPTWADKLRVGWLFRCVSAPGVYLPRYWSARALLGLIVKYRDQLPLEK